MADTIYWVEYPATIRRASLTAGGTPDTLYPSPPGPNFVGGLAIDAAAGRLYWTNSSAQHSAILHAPLAGGGPVDTLYGSAQGVSYPWGLAIDPAAGRVYWANGDHEICGAPLAGGGVDVLYRSTYPTNSPRDVEEPNGVAIDPAAGRIYWANTAASTICGAPLAGHGKVDTLYHTGIPVPAGVAIDAAAGRIYWTTWAWFTEEGAIQGGPLVPGGTAQTLYDSAQEVRVPAGVAIDPDATDVTERLDAGGAEAGAVGRWLREAVNWVEGRVFRPSVPRGRIYWSNGSPFGLPSDNAIRAAPIPGTGPVVTIRDSFATQIGALAVLQAPVATGPPTVSWPFALDDGPFGGLQYGDSHSGPVDRPLICSRGTWAPDLVGSFLYRAPQSFAYQWRLNGTDIPGATATLHRPTAPGNYSCRVTATNAAGSVTQTTAAVAVS